ncbi:hypothetical protein ACFSWE_15365 [Leucobacter albus]|uniref:Uncharacterized protein n=1 Tax=Leucobacter albus TaxID=272210 RepID=A0ABW3TSE6_9MICO
MSSKINYDSPVMENAAAGVAECAKAAREIGRYAQQHCSLDGAFGVLLQPLQPIHNAARDAVMDNLTALSEALYATGMSVLAARDDMAEVEEAAKEVCKALEAEMDGPVNTGGGGGDFGGGGGGGGGDFGGGGPAPVAEPPVSEPPVTPPVAVEPEIEDPKLPETPGSEDTDGEDTDGEDTDGEDTDGEDTDGEDTDPTKPGDEDADGDDTDGEDTDGEDTDGEDGEDGTEGNGHPVGCRCGECDAHPAGCQCNVCLGEQVQQGCPPHCGRCHAGTAHAPDWVVECGLPPEVASKIGTSEEVFAERWAQRDPIVVVRPSEAGGTVTIGFTPAGTGTTTQAMPGAIAFNFDDLVTAAYARGERSAL